MSFAHGASPDAYLLIGKASVYSNNLEEGSTADLRSLYVYGIPQRSYTLWSRSMECTYRGHFLDITNRLKRCCARLHPTKSCLKNKPAEFNSHLQIFLLKKKSYEEAIKDIQIAPFRWGKHKRVSLPFAWPTMFGEKVGQTDKSVDCFKWVIRMNCHTKLPLMLKLNLQIFSKKYQRQRPSQTTF